MKRVLILAYDYPPYNSVGGLRPAYWFKNLKEFEVFPIVITRQWSNTGDLSNDYISASQTDQEIINHLNSGLIIRSSYKTTITDYLYSKYGDSRFVLIRKSLTVFREIIQFYLPFGAKRNIYRSANKFLKSEPVDVIIATADPFVLFHYANKLSKKHNIPWIADYRDAWSHFNESSTHLFHLFERYQEKRIVQHAAHITTVSNFIARKVQSLVGPVPTTILPNGFDPFVLKNTAHICQSKGVFTIAHAGSVYDWHPLERFLETIAQFKKERPSFDFQILFYGLNQPERITPILESYPELISHIILEQRCPNEELIAKLRTHHVMLLFNYYAYMGTKIFDYLGIERNMLLCFENDSVANELKKMHYRINDEDANQHLQAETIREHQAGNIADDAKDLISILHEYANEFEETGKIACNSINVEKYSRMFQVEQLANIIHTQF